jgi:hypothetical protein
VFDREGAKHPDKLPGFATVDLIAAEDVGEVV